MEYKDYYKILGVDKNASEKEIKAVYRKLARQYHPDINPNDPKTEERFKEINEAYEVLGNPEKRSKYDRLGADWQHWQQVGGRSSDFNWEQWATTGLGGERAHVRYNPSRSRGDSSQGDFEDLFSSGGGGGSPFSDFFTSIFGSSEGGGRQRRVRSVEYRPHPQTGQNLEQEVEISLDEAYHGVTRMLTQGDRRLEVKIPAGARTGDKVRIGGEGGQTGDLYLKINVKPDPRFERKEDDLYVTAPVDLYTMVLGGEVRVPTLTGEVNLKIPAGSQNGQNFRLRGKGMPKPGKISEKGDLYARLDVRLPTRLTPKQRELFEQLRQEG